MVKSETPAEVESKWNGSTDRDDLCEPADKKDYQRNNHLGTTNRLTGISLSSGHQCNRDAHTNPNKQSNPEVCKIVQDPGSTHVHTNNVHVHNKTVHEHEMTKSVALPSTSYDFRPKPVAVLGKGSDASEEEVNETSYNFTIDDVRRALEAITTREKTVKNTLLKPTAPPKSNDKSSQNKEKYLNNQSDAHNQCKPSMTIHHPASDCRRVQDAGSSQSYAKDVRSKTLHPQQVLSPLGFPSTSQSNPLLALMQLNQSLSYEREKAVGHNNETDEIQNKTLSQHKLNNSQHFPPSSYRISQAASISNPLSTITKTIDDVERTMASVARIGAAHTETEVIDKIANEGPIIENIQCKEEHSIEKNVGQRQRNLDKNVELTKDKDMMSIIDLASLKDANILTEKDKHIYNIQTILECTNATLIQAHGDFTCSCYFCDQYYQNLSDLKAHVLNTHTTIKYAHFNNISVGRYAAKLDVTDLCCKLCNGILYSLETIISHLNEVHKKNLFTDIKNQILPFKYINGSVKCCICPMTFKTFRPLWKHLESHYRNFECKQCNYAFVSSYKLRRHERLVHKMGSFICQICSTKFVTEENLMKHLKKIHETNVEYKCSLCNRTFKDMTSKELHLESVHNVKPKNTSITISKISGHTTNISMETSQKCYICNVVLMSWDALSAHIKQCSYENRYLDKRITDMFVGVPAVQTVVPSTNSIELLVDNNDDVKTYISADTQARNKSTKQDKIRYLQPTDNHKKQTQCIDLTNDCIDLTNDYIDLTNGCVEPINTSVESRNVVGLVNTSVDSRNIGIGPINRDADFTKDCVDSAYKCQICDEIFITPGELTVHVKQCINSVHHFSGDKNKGKYEKILGTSSQVNGEKIANEEVLNIDNLSEKDMHLYNLKVILECSNASLIRSRDDFGYKCFFCGVHFQNPLDLKKHTTYHEHTTKGGIYSADVIENIYANFVTKLDITDLCCRLCSSKIDNFDKLVIHLKSVHKKKIFNVKNRMQVVKFNNTLSKYRTGNVANDTVRDKPHQCCYCNERFEHLRSKELHMLKAHNITPTNQSLNPTDNRNESINRYDKPADINVESANKFFGSNNYHTYGMFVPQNASLVPIKEDMNTTRHNLEVYDLETAVKNEWMKGDAGGPLAGDPRKNDSRCNQDGDMTSKWEASSSSDNNFNSARGFHQHDITRNMAPFNMNPNVNKSLIRHPIRTQEYTPTSYNPLGAMSLMIRAEPRILVSHPRMEDIVPMPFTSMIDVRRREMDTRTQVDKVYEGTTRNRIPDCSLREKHLHNVMVILKCTNATLVRSQDDAGYKCYYCEDSFQDPSELKQHSLQIHMNIEDRHFTYIANYALKLDITGLRCKICDRQIKSLESLVDHLNVLHDKRLFTDIENQIIPFRFKDYVLQCCICSESFNKLRVLFDHMRTHYRNFVCGICDAAFVTKHRLTMHEKNHIVGEFPCQLCNKVFRTKRLRMHHERITHYNLFTYKCRYCNERFKYLNQKESHLKWVHKAEMEEAITPNNTLNLDSNKPSHNSIDFELELLSNQDKHYFNIDLILNCTNATLIHTQETFGYICYFCDNYYIHPSKLKEHALDAHTIQPASESAHIPKTQIYKSYHLRNIAKLDITGLRCKLCDSNFDALEKIMNHLKEVHKKHNFLDTETRIVPLQFDNDTPQCCYCRRKFDSYVTLIKHLKANHYRNYICDACDTGFVNKKQLIHHITSNEEIHGNFMCNVCSEQFNSSVMLKEHENAFHDKVLPSFYDNNAGKNRRGRKRRHSNVYNGKCAVTANESVNPTNTNVSSVVECVISTSEGVQITKECVDAAKRCETSDKIAMTPQALSTDIRKSSDLHNDAGPNEAITETGNEKPVIEIVLTYKEEQRIENETDKAENEPQNVNGEPLNMNLEISQKCYACDMVFMTWDALSVHIKECTVFANRFLGENEDVNIEGTETVPNSKRRDGIPVEVDESTDELRNSLISKGRSLKSEKHFYNLKVILECTNATVFRQRRDGYKCYFCDNNYTNPADLKNHNINTHTTVNRKDFKIPLGNHKFVAYLDTTDLMCNLCGVNINNLQELFSHLNEVHQKGLFVDISKRILASKFNSNTKTANEKPYSYSCELCGKEFTTRDTMKNHVRTHEEYTAITCGYCNETFRNAKQKEVHLQFAHNVVLANGLEPTKQSGKVTSERVKVTSERVKTTSERGKPANERVEQTNKGLKRTHRCTICDKLFLTPKAVRYHCERLHYKKKNHFCPECNKGFFSIGEVKIHMNMHTKVPAFKCEICNNSYMRKNYYAEHMRIHTNERPYKCDICHKTFTSGRSLKLHQQSGLHNNTVKETGV